MTVRQFEEYIRTTYGPDMLDYEIHFREFTEDDYWWEVLDAGDIDIDEVSKEIRLG